MGKPGCLAHRRSGARGWVCGKGVALTPLAMAAATCKPGEPLAQGNPAGGECQHV